MLSLSQATSEALARTAVFEEELRKNNEIADRYEEQVNGNYLTKFSTQSFENYQKDFSYEIYLIFPAFLNIGSNNTKENAIIGRTI